MAEIHVLPGVQRRDLMGPAQGDTNAVLNGAIEANLTDVVVIGRLPDGERFVAMSMGDADRAVGALFGAATWLAQINVVNDVVIDTNEGA